MQEIIVTNLYLFLMAVVLAVLEIQIEGKHGWAKNLPTWRPKNANYFSHLFSRIMSGKELTGYHLSMFSFVFLIFGLPFVFGLPLTLENGLKALALYLLFSALWDFYWFVLNPWYPLKEFKKECLGFHHSKWFFGLPTDYWGALLLSFLVLLPIYVTTDQSILLWWGINVLGFLLETLLLIMFSTYVLRIDKWHSLEK